MFDPSQEPKPKILVKKQTVLDLGEKIVERPIGIRTAPPD